jgi:hypothetical protein
MHSSIYTDTCTLIACCYMRICIISKHQPYNIRHTPIYQARINLSRYTTTHCNVSPPLILVYPAISKSLNSPSRYPFVGNTSALGVFREVECISKLNSDTLFMQHLNTCAKYYAHNTLHQTLMYLNKLTIPHGTVAYAQKHYYELSPLHHDRMPVPGHFSTKPIF